MHSPPTVAAARVATLSAAKRMSVVLAILSFTVGAPPDAAPGEARDRIDGKTTLLLWPVGAPEFGTFPGGGPGHDGQPRRTAHRHASVGSGGVGSGRTIWRSGSRDWNAIAVGPAGRFVIINTTERAANRDYSDFVGKTGPELVRWFDRSGRLFRLRQGRALVFFRKGDLVVARGGDLFGEPSQGKDYRLASRRSVTSASPLPVSAVPIVRAVGKPGPSGRTELRSRHGRVLVHRDLPRFAERVVVVSRSGQLAPASPIFRRQGEANSAVGGLYWNPSGTILFESNTHQRPSQQWLAYRPRRASYSKIGINSKTATAVRTRRSPSHGRANSSRRCAYDVTVAAEAQPVTHLATLRPDARAPVSSP